MKLRPKCKLSPGQIKFLSEKGLSYREIAKEAGVSVACIQYYLNPKTREIMRKSASKSYNKLSPEARKTYSNTENRRAKDAQDKSLTAARNISEPMWWTTEEVDFLRENSLKKTLAEIAIDLKRTFYSVSHAAQRYSIKCRRFFDENVVERIT